MLIALFPQQTPAGHELAAETLLIIPGLCCWGHWVRTPVGEPLTETPSEGNGDTPQSSEEGTIARGKDRPPDTSFGRVEDGFRYCTGYAAKESAELKSIFQ